MKISHVKHEISSYDCQVYQMVVKEFISFFMEIQKAPLFHDDDINIIVEPS